MSLLNLTDNLSIFSITENKIDVSSCLLSNRDDSEIWPNLTEVGEFQDIFQKIDDIQRIDNVIYKFKTAKKRGRERNKESKKDEHTALSIDNIERKIQNHFLNFIISFLNDCVLAFFKFQKFTFLKFSYSEKIKVSFEYMKKIKTSTIKDLIENIGISAKYKHSDKNTNKMNLKDLSEFYWFRQIFEIKYLELFFVYYHDEQPLKEIKKFGQKIILSKNTKTFYYLLPKDKNLIDEIIKYTEELYLADINGIKDND